MISILAVLYLGTSTGTTVQMHYCMGKLADWSLAHNTTDTCDNCGMGKTEGNDNGCCKDEQKVIKNDNDQKTTESIHFKFTLPVIDLPIAFFSSSDFQRSSLTEQQPVGNAPPPGRDVAVYIRNCIFLI